jgi:hypothetical protein
MPPTSTRYLPIREAVCDLLASAPALADVKTIERDAEAFANLPATQYPALAVFFAEAAGEERAQWAGGERDHVYRLAVHVAVRSLESARACEDELFSYLEAVEDALRANPTLDGLVRCLLAGLIGRHTERTPSYWLSRGIIALTAQQKVS